MCNTQLLFLYLLFQFSDEKRLMTHHQGLQNVIEDQLSLAAILFLRTHYQEAIDIYKKILLDNRYVTVSKLNKQNIYFYSERKTL